MSHLLKLYSKQNCALCDQAEQLINQVLSEDTACGFDGKWDLVKVDIEQIGGACQEKYAWTIPVLMNVETCEEISWPFPPSRIRALIRSVRN